MSAVVGLVVLAGCLPRHAILRRDEVEAHTYAMDVAMDVTTDGLDVPPFTWRVAGNVATSYARTFRDGSMGHLVRFSGLRGEVTRDGETVAVPVPFAEATIEVRAFPDGEILTVTGGAAWTGENGHFEMLDAVWPALSPHLPGSKDEAAQFATSWPAWVPGGARVRNRLEAAWTPPSSAGGTWSYRGTLSGKGGNVELEGTGTGEVSLMKGDQRIVSRSTFDWDRTTHTRWGAGVSVRQAFAIRGELAHVGTEPAPPLDMPVTSDDRAADALPLRLRDGRVVQDAASAPTPALPFVLAPGDLGDDARAALRARIDGTW
ncbi:MAG: hypothetical protein ACK4YP_13035 [Myxococcota bacterium]